MASDESTDRRCYSEGVKIAGGKGESTIYIRSDDYSITKFSDFSVVLELSNVTLV